MTKGIRMVCQHCLRDQDVTELVSSEVFGVPYAEVKRFIGLHRELVDPKKHYQARLKAHSEVAAKMLKLLKDIAATHPDCCETMVQVRDLLHDILQGRSSES